MSDETPASTPSPDPGIDLALSFGPAWAREGAKSERVTKLIERHGHGEDRPERGGPGKRGPRRDEGRGPRPVRSGGGERRDSRDPRRDGGKRQGGRRDDSGPRPERAPRPEPGLVGWKVQFTPDRHGVDGLARQIKTTAKAYPLFDLARLVLEKSERYLVDFRRIGDQPATPLFQCRADGTLWLSEGDAIAHTLAHQLEKYYRRERIAIDPPKGAFPFVAVCGMTGTLLGPPNYHDYQAKLVRLHQQRFANMPFEALKARVRMERDEALIEKWREEQSARDVFYPVDEPGKAPATPPAADAAEEVAAPTPDASSAENVPTVDAPVAEEPELVTPAAETEPAATEPAAEAVEAENAASTETTESPEEPPAPAEELPPALKLDSLAEVERHFREHHARKAVVAIRERVLVPGPAALNDSAPTVLRLTRAEWEQLDRFPLPLAHVLGQQLAGRGLHLFKAHENITYVNVARPKYLDRVNTPVSEALAAMLDYIESHAQTPRSEQWKALASMRAAGGADPEAADNAVAADLSWLIHEGHVIDFIKRGLEAARKPKAPAPKPPKKTEPAAKATAMAAPTEVTEPAAPENPDAAPSSEAPGPALETVPADEPPESPQPTAPDAAPLVAEGEPVPSSPEPEAEPPVDAEIVTPAPANEPSVEPTPAEETPGPEPTEPPR